MADPEIEQLKQLVRQNIALSQENNKILRGMRSAGRLKGFLWLLFLAASIALSVWSYYYFLAPRIEQIKNIYDTTVVPLQGAQHSILDFFKNSKASTSTSSQ